MMGAEVGKKQIELYSKEGLKLLQAMSPETRLQWRRFEYRRTHLNYALAVATYRVDRLQALVDLYVAWDGKQK